MINTRDPATHGASDVQAICRMYVDTATATITTFLAARDHVTVSLETADVDFPRFLDRIDAKGYLEAARGEWAVRHNASISAND